MVIYIAFLNCKISFNRGNSSFRNIVLNCWEASSQLRLLNLTVPNVDYMQMHSIVNHIFKNILT